MNVRGLSFQDDPSNNAMDNTCPACDSLGVIHWPVYGWSGGWPDRFLGVATPVIIGEKKDDGPCPMCDGSGVDPHCQNVQA